MSQYFQFNHLPLVDQPNLQLPRGVLLDEELCLLESEYSTLESLSTTNKQRVFFNLPLPTIDRENFARKTSGSNTSGSTDPKFMLKTYTIKGKKYKIPYQYFASTVHFSTGICKENKGDENEFNETFVRDFLKYYEENYLRWKQIGLSFDRQVLEEVAARKGSIEKILTKFLYEVIKFPTRHSLEAKKDDIIGAIDHFAKQKRAIISGTEVDNSSTTIIFENFGLYSTSFMGIHCYPDLIIGTGLYQRPVKAELEPIACSLIGETKTPAMRLSGVYHLLTENRGDGSDCDEINEVIAEHGDGEFRLNFDRETGFGISNATKINDFQETVRKVVTTACYCGVNKVMVTTYKDTVLIHIHPDFIKLGPKKFQSDAAFNGKELVYIQNKHYHIKSCDPMIRLKILSFFHVSDTTVNELKLFQKNVGSYLNEKISILLAEQKEASSSPSTASANSPKIHLLFRT